MESKNLLALAITLTVGIILAGSLLMPVLNHATETEHTFNNSDFGFYQMKVLEAGDGWERDGTAWTYKGENLTTSSSDAVSIVVTDNTVVRQSGQVRGTIIGVNNATAADIVAVDDVDTMFINHGTTPINYTLGYGAVPEGDYILKTYDDKAYVHGDTPLWVTGITGLPNSTSTGNIVIHIDGTINDGVTITADSVSNGTTSNITTENVTINYEKVRGYDDLYFIESVVFTLNADYDDGDTTTPRTTTATYSTFILPKTITAEISGHLDPAQIAIVDAIPVLIIVALVMMAVGALYLKRDD